MKKTLAIILVSAIVLGIGGVVYWRYTESTKPSVTLIFPNGGETLTEGSTYTIRWNTNHIPATDKISITIRRVPPPPLQQEGQEFDPIIFVNLENTGSKDWTVSGMYPEGNYVLGITSYASIPVTNPISDESDATFRIAKSSWQSYNNKKFGYSINYPSDWTFREFPDTQTGAGFRPLSSANDIESECITIDERGTAANQYNTPFEEYVKTAAINEIQGYERLNSIQPVTAADGLAGFETTWIYKNFSGQEKTSLPITYFDNKKTAQVGGNQLKFKTVQVILNNNDCESIYNQMLSTFKINQF